MPVVSVAIREERGLLGHNESVTAETKRIDKRLTIILEKNKLSVAEDGGKPTFYNVVKDTGTVVVAERTGDIEPKLDSISIDKVTSYLIWSRTEPADWQFDIPRHLAALFSCSHASPLRENPPTK